MKKFFPMVLVLAIGFSSAASAQTLSQSTDSTTITTGAAFACSTMAPQYHAENSFWRSYNLATEGVTTNIDIFQVTFGIENAVTPGGPAGPGQPLEIRIYTDPTPAAIAPSGGLNLLHTEMFTIQDTTLNLMTVTLSQIVTVAASDTVVIEWYVPNGVAQGFLMFAGANSAGQTAPTFWSAVGCNQPEPIDVATVGFPNMHIILDMDYAPSSLALMYPGTGEDLILQTAINAAPLTTGIGQDVKTANANDVLTVFVSSPGGSAINNPLLVLVDTFTTGVGGGAPLVPGIVWIDNSFALLSGLGSTPYGVEILPSIGWVNAFLIPQGLSGTSLLFQSAVVNPAGAVIPNLYISEAHQIVNL